MSSKPPAESPASPWKAAEKKQADEKAAAEEYAEAARVAREEHIAACKIQAQFKGHFVRREVALKKKRAAEHAAYEKGYKEREARMAAREETKAMLRELPAAEVEDWLRQQEISSAVTVQKEWRRHKAKKHVELERREQNTAAIRIQKSFKKHKNEVESGAKRSNVSKARVNKFIVEPDALDIVASVAAEMTTEDYAPRVMTLKQQSVESVMATRKFEAARDVAATTAASDGVTMETFRAGREKTRTTLARYREQTDARAEAKAKRDAIFRETEKVFRAQRAQKHQSLAELSGFATPASFAFPAGTDEKSIALRHKEALDAADCERKWWKPLLSLNREQRVLDKQEEERRRKVGETGASGGGGSGRGSGGSSPGSGGSGYANNRTRAGVRDSITTATATEVY